MFARLRQVAREEYINMAEHIAKVYCHDSTPINFIDDEADKLLHPHNDTLVGEIRIVDNVICRVLIDNRSSTDILFHTHQAKDRWGCVDTYLDPAIWVRRRVHPRCRHCSIPNHYRRRFRENNPYGGIHCCGSTVSLKHYFGKANP